LAEAIQSLRRELLSAVAEGEGEEIRFALGPIELELDLTLTKEAGANAGIALWMVTIGGKADRTSATTQRMTLTLTPVRVLPDGEVRKDVVVGSELAHKPVG
jgi:hypothetical protein